jgi:hypothetical protein
MLLFATRSTKAGFSDVLSPAKSWLIATAGRIFSSIAVMLPS